MRFRFLNGMDCPDWLLAEVVSFSKLSVIKFKTFCALCVNALLSGKTTLDDAEYTKFATETINVVSIQHLFVSVSFILEKACKADCSGEDLDNELQQLGLPSEHSKQIGRVLTSNKHELKEFFMKKMLKEPPIVINSVSHDDKIVTLNCRTLSTAPQSISMDKAMFQHFQNEMQRADDFMKKYA